MTVACSMCGSTPPRAHGAVTPDDDLPSDGAAPSDVSADNVIGAGDNVPAASDGVIAADSELPLTWVTSWEGGALSAFCPTCARTHLRSIEAKLDSAWW